MGVLNYYPLLRKQESMRWIPAFAGMGGAAGMGGQQERGAAGMVYKRVEIKQGLV